jgi:dipeptidyl aminopeptidase/acylaminoacyl peptidase
MMPIRKLARRVPMLAGAVAALLAAPAPSRAQERGGFTLDQVLGFTYASDLTAAATGERIAWVSVVRGIRNVFVAEGPAFAARRLTGYQRDDGQELTSLSISADGKHVVYARGGDHDGNWGGEGGRQPDPTSSPKEPHVQIFAVAFDGGTPKLLAQGDNPAISPRGDRVAFVDGGQIKLVSLGGADTVPRTVYARGTSGSLQWSPSGDRLAFVSSRGDHSFVGVYERDDKPLVWMSPSTNNDFMPRWSPDGTGIAFVRLPGIGGPPPAILGPHLTPFDVTNPLTPFQIWTAVAATGQGRMVWESPKGSRGGFPTTDGEANLHWMAGNRLTFLADLDGWEHLYSIATDGGAPLLLTPGKFMTEFISPSPDGRSLVYSANTGSTRDDFDRRHVFAVPVDAANPVELTPGEGIEWDPVMTGDGRTVAFIGGTARRPMLAGVVPASGGAMRSLGAESIAADWPGAKFVTPRAVTFRASDGVLVHGQLFQGPAAGKSPAILFVHGGPPRQMLLGFHTMDYYNNAYAMNQYLASHGYVVLAVNYRLGIGYGHEFHNPDHAGMLGASEYQDVVAANRYLRTLAGVDSTRIGIWGGSYGGLLTALALARNSNLFASGVDLHGVHDWIADWGTALLKRDRYEQPADLKAAIDLAWRSSPMSSVATWQSPVLLIHGDDDRNVRFHQTVDLVQRLRTKGVRYEELVLPDEIHGFLLHASWQRADSATAAWFNKTLMRAQP